jgi:WD40 repeat protein
MAVSSSCPSEASLRQMLAGTTDAGHADLLAHLDECAACQRTLDALAGASPELLAAAAGLRWTAYAEEPSLRRVLQSFAVSDQPTIPYRTHGRAAWVQALLRPGDSSGAVGRLGNYEVHELLGQGGMGLVLKAFDPPLNRWVAIKVLAPDLAGDPVARQRFAREAQSAAAVRHEHVITIHAVSEANGLPFLVMEHVAGGSLQDYLDLHGAARWQTAARLGAEVAAGLAAAHAHGLIHRDIKPSNILLEPESVPGELGTAKIGDFGLARVADESRLTQTGIVPGTPMYMSPEQALSEPLDDRTDLFSLGSVLYALCTGQEPFPSGTPMAVLRQVCEATPRPVREINPEVPSWLAAVIDRLHAKRPGDRFASAAEVEELLRYNLEHPDQPRLVRPPRGKRPRRRWYRLLTAVALLGLLLTAGLALTDAFRGSRREATAEIRDSGLHPRATLRGHRGPVWSAAFAPDGQTLATSSDDATVKIWDVATGREKATWPGHGSAVLVVAFAHSGKFLVSGDSDGALRIWDAATGTEQPPLPHQGGSIRRLAMAPDDETVAVGGSGRGIELWDPAGRKLRRSLAGRDGTILALTFSPDGKLLAAGDASGFIRFWDTASGSEEASFRGDTLGVRALAFAPDGQTLVSTGSGDKDVKLWDVVTRHLLATFTGYENGPQKVAIAPGGRLLATGLRDGTVRLAALPTGRVLAALPAHKGNVWTAAFSPDGRTLVTSGEDRLARLWDVSDWIDGGP